jgi:shikimate kinase
MQNIILTGFMGTGKSTVGQVVAARLGRRFVDMDALIEQREGRPIPQIFAEAGEPYFRQLEAGLCRELAEQAAQVIATGGGALVPEANWRTLAPPGGLSAWIVRRRCCGSASARARTGLCWRRRMMTVSPAGGAVGRSRPAYGRIEQHVDVTHLSPEEAAARVVSLFISQTQGENQ